MTTFYFFILLANTMAAKFQVNKIIDRSQKIYTGIFNFRDAVHFGDDIIVYDYDFLKAASDKNSHEYEIAQRNYQAIAPVLRKRLNKIAAVCDYDDPKMTSILETLRIFDPNMFKDKVQEIDRSRERFERRKQEEAEALRSQREREEKYKEFMIDIGLIDAWKVLFFH